MGARGKAPGRPGRPRRAVSIDPTWVAQQHTALVEAIREFRAKCAARRALLFETKRWWGTLSKDKATSLLRECGFSPEWARELADLRPTKLLPGGGEPRRLAFDLVRAESSE